MSCGHIILKWSSFASIVIGSGSLSFEMIRALVERLPVMVCPRWVQVKAQPLAVEDLLQYLLAAVDLPLGPSQIYEIGGPDQVSYGQIMQEYCPSTRSDAVDDSGAAADAVFV